MLSSSGRSVDLEPETRAFYQDVMRRLQAHDVPYLVGGAYALERFTGLVRHTKDFDLFLRPADARTALEILAQAGYRTELTYPHWLGKAFHQDAFVDLIFASGNGVARVDDDWFAHAGPERVLDLPVRLCPPEEMIWSKGFIMERERFDGADIAHVLRACATSLDWHRLLARFGSHGPVLLSHLILFGFIYPNERAAIPPWVMQTLWEQIQKPVPKPKGEKPLCQGTLLSREQYLADILEWGYQDARTEEGTMTPAEIAHWTAAIQ